MISKQTKNVQNCHSCFCFYCSTFGNMLAYYRSCFSAHLNMGAGSLFRPLLASDFMSVQGLGLLLEHNRKVGFLNDRWVYAQQRPWCEQEGSPPGSGSKEFPGLTPKCLYTHKNLSTFFHIHPFLNLPLADGAHSTLTYLNMCVSRAHASVYVCVCYGVLYLGGAFPIGLSADFSILPGLTSWARTQTHTKTHTHMVMYLLRFALG